MTRNLVLSCFLIGGLVAGCDSSTEISVNGNGLTVQVPESIRSIQSIGLQTLQLEISVNDEEPTVTPFTSGNDSVSVVISVPSNQPNDVSLTWVAVAPTGDRLPLASVSQVISADDQLINVSEYIDSGDDYDNDGRTNLAEARDNRNLFSAIDLTVPFTDALFVGVNNVLKSDNLNQNLSGDDVEADLESKFSVWHNNTELMLYLCGQDKILSESSDQYWHDDTVYVFLDGGDSDGTAYDALDDYQLAFIRSTETLVVDQGPSNSACPNGECISFRFFNTTSTCEYEFSATFPLQSLNINTTFGFDIEITDDDNGDLRDGASQWIGYNDQSHLDPSTFGTLRLGQ